MLQQIKSNPFYKALVAVFFTFSLFIVFGYNGWGTPAANEQAVGEISRWCERVSGGFFREPANTLGNLGFVITGLYMFYKLSNDATQNEFLEKVKEYVGETCLLVTGDTSFEERQYAKEQILSKTKMCIAGSRQIFSEGISINILSCVILAVPMSNDSLLEQIVGRIMRPHPGKLNPIVVDIQFSGWADKKQNTDRLGLYMKKGWETISV